MLSNKIQIQLSINKIHFVYGSRPSLADYSEFKAVKEIDFKRKTSKSAKPSVILNLTL